MEQKVLQRKVNYIAPTLNTETESETAYRQIRVAAYCRVSTPMEEQLNSYEVQVKHYTDKINSEPKWSFAGIYADATVIIGLKQNPTHGRRFSPIFFA